MQKKEWHGTVCIACSTIFGLVQLIFLLLTISIMLANTDGSKRWMIELNLLILAYRTINNSIVCAFYKERL
jgi:hypothetical protein